MQFFRKFFRISAVCCLALTIAIMTAVVTYNIIMPSSFNIIRGQRLELPNAAELTGTNAVSFDGASAVSGSEVAPKSLTLKLFNIIPIKTTSINVMEDTQLVPGGTPFGIKLFSRGVMVIALNSVETETGVESPAKQSGIQKGDVLLSMNSVELTSNEQVAQIIGDSGGKNVIVSIQRDDKIIKTILTPKVSIVDGRFKGGLWVRDSSAGIGTVTYYDDKTTEFGGLGHGICDADTGKVIPLNHGEVCEVSINSLQKGRAGVPGEIRGSFASDVPCGILSNNNECGIFGRLNSPPNNLEAIDIMLKQEVRLGAAKIICTLDKSGPQEYDIQIVKIDLNPKNLSKNMIVEVTDQRLLGMTGGIIQGMSGSPILQDGKILGAVTHVFVNNPQKGYAIFVENMISQSK